MDKEDKSKKWTQEEISILKENYIFGNIHNIEKLLPNRSYKSITSKARKLNLKTREYWSDKEIEIMKSNYHLCTVDEMLKLLPNRNRTTIIAKAISMGLKNSCKYQEYEVDFLINNWKVLSDKEIGKILNKPYRGVIAKRLSLGLLRDKENSSYNDLSEFVRRNNLEWKEKSMINCGYKCVLTGKRFDDIHHIYGLNLILNETLDDLNIEVKDDINNYTDEELREILDLFRAKQLNYPLGVCLCKEVHMLFHNDYGYGNNTQNQWDEFVINFKDGKYNEYLSVA